MKENCISRISATKLRFHPAGRNRGKVPVVLAGSAEMGSPRVGMAEKCRLERPNPRKSAVRGSERRENAGWSGRIRGSRQSAGRNGGKCLLERQNPRKSAVRGSERRENACWSGRIRGSRQSAGRNGGKVQVESAGSAEMGSPRVEMAEKCRLNWRTPRA